MKKVLPFFLALITLQHIARAQENDYAQQMQTALAQFNKATTVADLKASVGVFEKIATLFPNEWLPWYYAATGNARIGFLYQDDGEKIEPFSKDGEQQIRKARSLLDSTKKQELSEVFCVMSMVYRTKVFINPMTYGREFGPRSQQYLEQSRKLNPGNPRALYLDGWVKYYSPKMYGGDKQAARQLFTDALAALGKETNTGLLPHWGQQECTAMLAKYKN